MKVALVHDYIKEYGGAERVLEALHEIWPDAPVFTSVYLPEFLGPHRERFNSPAHSGLSSSGSKTGEWDIRTSFLQYLPFKAKLISPFRLIAPFVFRSFDFSQYDVVIVSATGAYAPNTIKIRNPKSEIRNKSQNTKYKIQNPIHVSYCHTPPRYLYGFATAREWKKNIIFRVLGEIANHFLRLVDFKSAQNVDYFIANSKNVAGRIKKFYRKDSMVIYPPVEITNSKFQIPNKSQNTKYKIQNTGYFLAGGRLARPKHIDLIVRACQKLNVPLKVFGRGFGGWEMSFRASVRNPMEIPKQVRDDNLVEHLGEVTDEEKMELMRNAKAYIFAAEDEDFGITPVEAMSVGTPVIAYRSGGVVESVLEGKTGLFFNELTFESLTAAIKQFNRVKRDNAINPADCIKQAEKFSKERFKKEIKYFVENKVKHES